VSVGQKKVGITAIFVVVEHSKTPEKTKEIRNVAQIVIGILLL